MTANENIVEGELTATVISIARNPISRDKDRFWQVTLQLEVQGNYRQGTPRVELRQMIPRTLALQLLEPGAPVLVRSRGGLVVAIACDKPGLLSRLLIAVRKDGRPLASMKSLFHRLKPSGLVSVYIFLILYGIWFYSNWQSDVSGQLVIDGREGQKVFVPDSCSAGTNAAVLHDSTSGVKVWVTASTIGFWGYGNIELTRASCQKFNLELENSNSTYNDKRAVQGGFSIDCKLPEKRISGRIEFDSCH